MNTPQDKKCIWVDAEVHLFPPEWCDVKYFPPSSEEAIIRAIYTHPERELALSRATAEGLLEEMARAEIDRAIIMGLPWRNEAMCRRNNEYIAEVIARYPHRFIGMGVFPSPGRQGTIDEIRRCHEEYGFRGVKVVPSWQGYRLNDRAMSYVIEELCRTSMVLMPHTDHLFVRTEHVDTASALYDVACRYPELKVLAPHLAGMLCLYKMHEPKHAAFRNVMFIASVPATMRMTEYAVDAAGAESIAFGTDFPFNPSHDQLIVKQAFESLSLSKETRNTIAGANVLRFLGVSG